MIIRNQTQYLFINNYNKTMQSKYVKERVKKVDGTYLQREYRLIKQLGRGTFGTCYEVIRTSDKKKYAMKIINKQVLQNKRTRSKMQSEIKIHGKSKHKNICDLERAFQDQQNVYILLQLCAHGNMFELLKKRKKFTAPQTQFFVYQLIDALCYLHSRDVIHRDIKLGNLLIDEHLNLKLADFGLATKIQFKGDLKHSVCGTPNYMAPEIIQFQIEGLPSGHSFEVDVWSVGVILYLFLIGKPPFETDNKQKTFKRIMKVDYSFPEKFKNNEAKDLISKILVIDPCKRYTFEEIMSHSFMNPYNGIPRQLPLTSLQFCPNIEQYDKQAHKVIKKAARDASASTLRSQLSLNQQQLDDLEKDQNSNTKETKTKTLKGLLSTALSASSSLSKSLKKLWTMRDSSNSKEKGDQNQNNVVKSLTRLKTESVNQPSGQFRSYCQIQQPRRDQHKQILDLVYIVKYKQDQIWNYQLSNGYTGTYESGFQLLYNNLSKIYIEIEGEKIKVLKKADEVGNQRLANRKKFLKNSQYIDIECKPYKNSEKLISIKKIYKPKDQNSNSLIIFKFSNGNFQAHDHKKDKNLMITQNDIIMIELQKGRQVRRISENKKNYEKCPSSMIELYLQVKKMIKIIMEKDP